MPEFEPTIKGTIEAMCYASGMDFALVRPESVTIQLTDGRTVGYFDKDAIYTGSEVTRITFSHPSSEEPFVIEVGQGAH